MAKLISFVLPVYNEEAVIREFFTVLRDSVAEVADKYECEFVFVNDGSRDHSLEILRTLQEIDTRIRIVNFARNFGQQMAVTAGLDHAKGDAVVIMDCDLQDPPSVALEMIEVWAEQGYQVVYGKRRSRGDTWFKRNSAAMFYKVIDNLTSFHIPQNTGDFRLLDRKVVDVIKQFREQNRFMRGIVSYVGFRQHELLFDRPDRFAGETHYSLRKMIKLAFDGIYSFSNVPLAMITRIGALFTLISGAMLAVVVAREILRPESNPPVGIILVAVILFVGGVQMVMLGIMAAYIGRIYAEVQRRPLYIVEEVHENA